MSVRATASVGPDEGGRPRRSATGVIFPSLVVYGMLAATLDVETDGDTARFGLTVANEGDDPVSLTFSDGQRADFVVRDAEAGTERWRWSDGRMFPQMLGSEELAPGESVTYDAEWDTPEGGSFVCRGELVDNANSASAETSFSL